MPAVYNKKDHVRPEVGLVYVGRPSKFGNPFIIGHDGTREEVVEKYRAWIGHKLVAEPYFLEELVGKDLVCWCAPLPCHADILLELANGR